jgi:CheY-like chemotaxis protein
MRCFEVVGGFLREVECEIALASSGSAAMEILSADTFDILLLDVMMPGINGFELFASQDHTDLNTGLDLPMARMIAEAHRGELKLFNNESIGARVELKLLSSTADVLSFRN